MKFKKLLAVVLSIAMVLSSMSFNVFAAEPNISDYIINVDASNAQDVLDGRYGSINGKTINFTENITEVLELARPTKYVGSETEYVCSNGNNHSEESKTFTDVTEFIAHYGENEWHTTPNYYRTLANITFTADNGVTVAGFAFNAGHVYGECYDYVRDKAYTSGSAYYKYSSLENITFDGLTVTGRFDAKLYQEGSTVKNVVFDGCTFTGTTDDGSDAAIKFLADNQYFTDVTVENCSIDGYNQGVYIAGVDSASVINNNISNTVHNAIALQSCNNDNPAKGTIVVKENYITNVTNRAIRMNYVGDADIAINNNIMVNCGDDAGQLIKAESVAAEATVDLEANYWDGKDISVAVPGFTAPTTVGVTGGTWDDDISDYVANGYELDENGEVVESAPVATVNGKNFTDIQEAIKAAAPGGTVHIINDVTVDKWIMFAETMSIGNGNLITLNINGMTINGNNHTLTIKSIESAGNGNCLFYDAQNLNINNLTIEYVDAAANQGGIGLQSGTIENVNFVGGGNGILPGEGDITINDCEFATNGTAIYYEKERGNLKVTNNTFNQPEGVNVILLRGATEFTGNTVNSGRTVNVVSGSPVVTGNDFGDVRFKVYNASTATIEYNEINVLEFDDATKVNSTFNANIYSAEAKAALKTANVTVPAAVVALDNATYSDIYKAFEEATDGSEIVLLGDIYIKEPLTIKTGMNVTLDLNGATLAGLDTSTASFGLINIQSSASLTIDDETGNGKITLKAVNDRDWNAYSSVVSNQRGKLIVNGGTIEHLGGTDMAYGIDNLTNGKGTYAETVINGGTVKSTYRAIRQFLNGVEAQNILTINGGVIEGANKAVWMQDPSKNANTGTLTITKNAEIKGDIYLFVTEGSTEWPVDVNIVTSAVNGEILTANIPEGYEIVDNNGEFSVKESVIPEGTVNYCYTSTDRFWGQSKANATESFVIKIYEGDMQIASASLNNINGIINGDVEVSWWIPFSGNADEYWDIAWAEGYPKYDMNPTAVKLFSDGVLVDTNSVKFNAPDDLNKIAALAEDAEGNVKAYTSLKDAIGKFNGRKVNVLRDVSESIDGFYGCTLTTNVEGGVTITDTNTENWIDFDDVTVGKGVTVDINLPYSGDSENVILGTLVAGETYYHGYDAKTTIKDGGKVIVEGTTILRYNETDDAGLYIYGDGDNSTVEFDCGYYIGAYSGTFYAKDANINAGYFLLKNSYDNDSYADIDMSLDNSSVTIVGTSDTQDSFIIDDKAHLTLTNSSVIDDVRDFNILAGTQLDINIDSTSSIEATNATAADDVEFNVAIDANGKIIFTRELSGSGTEEDPYLINNADELKGFRTNVNNGNNYAGKYVKLNADIDLAYENWTPIGDTLYNTKYAPVDASVVFSGVFDGNNKVISNLKIEKTVSYAPDATEYEIANTDANVGLFGITGEGAVIKDLTITNIDIDTNGRNVGALAGFTYKTTLENITVTGNIDIRGGCNVAGAFAMSRYNDISAKNITVSGNDGSVIKGYNIVGGITAEIAPNGSTQTFKNFSVENVTIEGVSGVGGIVGLLTEGTVSDVSVKNATIIGKTTWKEDENRIRLGSVVGLLGNGGTNYSTVANAVVENVTGKNLEGEDVVLPVVGANYSGSVGNATEARIGDKYYARLTSALKVAQPGETVTLLADVAEEVVIPEGVIFDANGFSYIVTGLKGEGTEENPYLISSKSELEWFRDNVDKQAADGSTQYAGKYIKLTTDIDLAGENWNPIGSMSGDHGSFKGIFDGAGHTISNLTVEQAGNGIGLFARTAGNAVIKNLNLNNVKVKSTDNSNYVGGLVGNSYASTKIENVHVTGKIDISGRGYIGGISGHGYVVMDNVSVVGEGTISSTFWCAGGVLGYAGEGATNIMNAHVEGITITSAAGGLGAIVGMAEDNNGTQPISGSNLSAKDVQIKTYVGGYGTSYADYALGYLYGGNPTSKLTGTLVAENVVIETSTGEKPSEISDAVVKVGNSVYFDLESAFKAATSGCVIELLSDITISDAWDCRNNGAKFTVPVTIEGNGKTLKFTGDIKDNNWNTVFRFEDDATVKNLTIDVSEATSVQRAISSKLSITADNVKIIGNDTTRYGIIFGEGAGAAISDITATITNSEFANCKAGVSDNANGQDAKAVTITGSKFNNSSAVVSASETVTFTGNEVENGYVNISSYSVPNELSVTAKKNILDTTETYAEDNTISAKTIDAQEGFLTPVAIVDGKYYSDLQSAIDKANGSTITVLADMDLTDETITIPADKALTLDLNGKTITATENKAEQNSKGNYELFYNLGELKVVGNGAIELTAATDRDWNALSAIFHNRGGVLTIENGTFTHNGGTDMAYVVDNSANSYGDATTVVNGGSLKSSYIAIRNRMDTYGANGGGNGIANLDINGGTFEGKYAIWGQVSSANVKGNIDISNGTFIAAEGKAAILVDEDTADEITTAISGGTFSSDVSAFLADGVSISKNADGTYGVVAERKLEVEAITSNDEDKVVAGEEFKVEVKLTEGENIVNASWVLGYKTELFELKDYTETTGSIKEGIWKTHTADGEVFAKGEVIKTYTFVAKAVAAEVTDYFTLSDTTASTFAESRDNIFVAAANNEKDDVTIIMKDYEVSATLGDAAIDMTANEPKTEVTFDGNAHTVVVKPADANISYTVEYTVNGNPVEEVALTTAGVYEVLYTIDAQNGYADKTGKITITIKEPEFVVEVTDWTNAGKRLVLVYTEQDNLYFTYDNNLMIDVTERNYEYITENNEKKSFAHVFAFVTDDLIVDTLDSYKANIKYLADGTGLIKLKLAEPELLADINFSKNLNVQDISVEYGIVNLHNEIYGDVKYQKHLLKGDVNGDKIINGKDTSYVVSEVKAAMGLR